MMMKRVSMRLLSEAPCGAACIDMNGNEAEVLLLLLGSLQQHQQMREKQKHFCKLPKRSRSTSSFRSASASLGQLAAASANEVRTTRVVVHAECVHHARYCVVCCGGCVVWWVRWTKFHDRLAGGPPYHQWGVKGGRTCGWCGVCWVTSASESERIESAITRFDGLGAAHYPPLTADCHMDSSHLTGGLRARTDPK